MSLVLGFSSALVGAFGWGSWPVVIKSHSANLKDGMLFQLWMCTGVLLVGFLTLAVAPHEVGYRPGDNGMLGELRPQLPLLCVLSGTLWSFGNLCTVEMVRALGIGLAMAIQTGCSILIAFVAGVSSPCLRYECLQASTLLFPEMGFGGCLLSVVALLLFSRVKPPKVERKRVRSSSYQGVAPMSGTQQELFPLPDTPRVPDTPRPSQSNNGGTAAEEEETADLLQLDTSKFDRTTLWGIALALFAGFMYGIQFLPCSIYSANHHPDPLAGSLIARLRVTLSQFMGSFISAFCIYTGYVAIRYAQGKSQAEVPVEAMIPSMGAGALWAFSSICAMISMDLLGYGVGYALTSNGAFLVSIVWSVAVFHEVSGRRDLTLFGLAAFCNVCASLLIVQQRRLSSMVASQAAVTEADSTIDDQLVLLHNSSRVLQWLSDKYLVI